MKNTWLMDSGCSCHMTENTRLFSSVDPMIDKEYITFEVNSRGKVVPCGTILANENLVLKDVVLLSNLHFNLLLVLQFLEDNFEVRFKNGLSHVLDGKGDLIYQISPFGRVFCIDFFHPFGPSRCLVE
jgi:hypothetical protein